MILTFDPYYNIKESNEFIKNLKENKINFNTYILSKSPYYWFYEVADKYKPVFLKFNEANSTDLRFMLPKLKELTPSDENYLRRIPKTPSDFERYVSPNIFKKAKDAEYFCIFRYKSISEINKITETLGIKIYILPKKVREWNIAFTFNKMIRNFVFGHYILFEKTKKTQFNKVGEIELYLNNKVFVTDKMKFKTRDLPFSEDGTYYPLKFQIKQ